MILLKVFLFAVIAALSMAKTCKLGPADVMFVISSNSTFDKVRFEQKLEVVEKFASSVTIGPNDVRVGIITEYEYADLEFQLNDHMDKQELSLAIMFTYYATGKPTFGCGLEYIQDHGIDADLGGRPGVPDIVVFLTDGVPGDSTLAQNEAKKLTDSGVTVITLGAGDIDRSDLVKLASGCHYVGQAQDFSSAEDLATLSINLTCDATNGVPLDDCECQLIAEVVFLLDVSSAQGKDKYSIQTDFAQALASELNIASNETRIAALTYATYKHPQFGLTDHTNKTEAMLALHFIPFQGDDGRHVEEGFDFIEANITGRVSAQKIVVVTSTGPQSSPNQAQAAAERLKNNGFTILSIGVGATNQKELENIATSSEYVKHYATFKDLLSAASSLGHFLCHGQLPYTTNAPVLTSQVTLQSGSTVKKCSFNPCSNGGTCVVLGDMYECRCTPGYTGTTCSDPLIISSTTAYTSPVQVSTRSPPSTPNMTNPKSCPQFKSTNWVCGEAEVVFMIEYGKEDVPNAVDHEVDYFNFLLEEYRYDPQHVRVGVVVYRDTVREVVHLDEYENDKAGLKARIDQLNTELTPSGDPNLASALDFVRQNCFKGARPGVPKMIISIVHQSDDTDQGVIIKAGEELRKDCGILHIQAVQSRSLNETTLKQIAYSPNEPFYQLHSSFTALELDMHYAASSNTYNC